VAAPAPSPERPQGPLRAKAPGPCHATSRCGCSGTANSRTACRSWGKPGLGSRGPRRRGGGRAEDALARRSPRAWGWLVTGPKRQGETVDENQPTVQPPIVVGVKWKAEFAKVEVRTVKRTLCATMSRIGSNASPQIFGAVVQLTPPASRSRCADRPRYRSDRK